MRDEKMVNNWSKTRPHSVGFPELDVRSKRSAAASIRFRCSRSSGMARGRGILKKAAGAIKATSNLGKVDKHDKHRPQPTHEDDPSQRGNAIRDKCNWQK